MKERKYVILGDNNFWYKTIICNPEDVQFHIKSLKEMINTGVFESSEPNELYAFMIDEKGSEFYEI